MKAMIPAAVKGSRVRPPACDFPQPMKPIFGKPATVCLIGSLASYGARAIMANQSVDNPALSEP